MRRIRNLLVIAILITACVSIVSAIRSDSTPIKSITSILGATDTTEKNDTPWYLLLVNKEHPLPYDYSFNKFTLSDGSIIDERIYPELQDMFDAARADGIYPKINYAYRSNEEQKEIYDRRINEYLAEGYSQQEAEELAGTYVMLPGTSEHETGLALDITADKDYCTVEDLQAWFLKNSWQYGFTVRYPSTKTEITGINYEPWHYRYVGKEAAQSMYVSGKCLEEYVEQYTAD